MTATENVTASPQRNPGEHPADAVVRIEGLTFRYGDRPALAGLSLSVRRGELFGLLGPNGSGKTTCFRILSTALRPGSGSVVIDGHDVATAPGPVRRRLGVAFQSPSLDGKLTVAENLRFHGNLFGLRGKRLRGRMEELLARFSLADRRRERVESLSGGLARRVELAKALLPAPPVLLLDEPSTGLDPAARLDFWRVLADLRKGERLTVIVATHLMDEAEKCDRVALLDRGSLAAVDTPEALKRQLGGGVLILEANGAPEALAQKIVAEMGLPARAVDGRVRLEAEDGAATATLLLRELAGEIASLNLGRPTLEDVFLARTGRGLAGEEAP